MFELSSFDNEVDSIRLKEFSKYESISFIFSLILAGLFIVPFVWVIRIMFDFIVEIDADVDILIPPKDSLLFFNAIFLSMFFSGMLVTICLKLFLREKWEYFLLFLVEKYRNGYLRVVKLTFLFLGIIGFLMLTFYLDWYIVFKEDKILINDYFSIGAREYRYEEIDGIASMEYFVAPNSDVVYDPHYVVYFNDGNNWSTREQGFSNDELNDYIIELLERKTGLKLKE